VDAEPSDDFAQFYAAARDGCLRAVCAVVGNPEQAEELTAEAFARAFAHWRKVRRHPAPQAWIVRVALNTHVSWWRKRRREIPWHSAGPALDHALSDADLLHQAASNGSPGYGLDLDGPALTALRALPRRQREVIALRVILDLDTHATAEALGIAPGTVTVHLFRATSALRTALAPQADEEWLAP
jgi:DNA-directed RNA polymerase specialized sigma24 family protein